MSSDQLSYDELCSLKDVKCKRLICFTNREIPDLDYCFTLKSAIGKPGVGSFANVYLNGFRIYEKEFDYTAWLNGDENFRTTYFEKGE